jgi:hypothetical protein
MLNVETMSAKSMTVKEAANQMGKAQAWVRAGLRMGWLPFGTAGKTSTKWNYYISPERFRKYIDGTLKEEAE